MMAKLNFQHHYIYIYIYSFSRRFYPKRLTGHSDYSCFFVSICVPWEFNPQPLVLQMQCSTTEPQEHYSLQCHVIFRNHSDRLIWSSIILDTLVDQKVQQNIVYFESYFKTMCKSVLLRKHLNSSFSFTQTCMFKTCSCSALAFLKNTTV